MAARPFCRWTSGTWASMPRTPGGRQPRVTINAGLRWEPYFGQSVTSGAVYNFSRENFRNNVRSQTFVNAPAGLLYPGDPGFPPGKRGTQHAVAGISPRASASAGTSSGNGRTAVRASYGLTYDFPNAEYQLINANSPPFGNRTIVEDPPGGFDRPVRAPRRGSAPDSDEPRHAVHPVRRLRRDRAAHQLAAHPAVERDDRAAARAWPGRWRRATSAATPIDCGSRSRSIPACSSGSVPARSTASSMRRAATTRT